MRAGYLRHSILIEQKTVTVDASGDRTEAWTTYADVYANIATNGGREFFAAKQTIADLTHAITIRFIAGIKPDMRVRFVDPKNSETSRYFNIRAVVNPDERNEMQMLQCSEIAI